MPENPPAWALDIIDRLQRIEAALSKEQFEDPDPWLHREDAARCLNVALRTFDRMRKNHEQLRPVSLHPLRWRRSALNLFKYTGDNVVVARGRGRPRSHF